MIFCIIEFNVLHFSSTSGSESSDEESSINTNESQMTASRESYVPITFQALFPTMLDVYGTEPKKPTRSDILTYKK